MRLRTVGKPTTIGGSPFASYPLTMVFSFLRRPFLPALGLGLLLSQGCSTLRPLDTPAPTPSEIGKAPVKKPPAAQAKLPQTGEASWYGARHQGKRTASGEIFDHAEFTAAHRTLLLGSKVKVTNLANGKSVEVTINDRGPFAKNRIIDLSQAAAKALEMVHSGKTMVRLELSSEP
jgi:rare lipoprotein A